MEESRTKKTKRNIMVSFLYTALLMLFQFVSRSVIIKYLGEEYLGLSSLFASILQVLNMTELGFSGAIVYNMYKPLAENNTQAVCALLAYYKKVYRTIGLIIMIAGITIIPIIPRLINGLSISKMDIYFLYCLYLANTVVSYFLFAYKTSLLEAVQRMDLAKFSYIVVSIVQYTLQILSIVILKNYYMFVFFMCIGSCAKNYVASYLSKKYFPQYECYGELTQQEKENIIARVKGLMVGSISSISYTTFDSIILSSFVGLSSVAIYNNYVTVMTGVTTIISLIRNAMQASVGDSIAKDSIEKNYSDMILWQFLFSFAASWCTAVMFSLFQPFMLLWMGRKMLLPTYDVILICAWFNITVVQHSFLLYLAGNGLWWEVRGPYICSTIVNLILNLVLGRLYGITGIIFASLFSILVFGLIWHCIVVFKEYFRKSPSSFFAKQLFYLFISVVVSAITYFICLQISVDGLLGLLIKLFASAGAALAVLVLVYWKTSIFKRSLKFLISVIKS